MELNRAVNKARDGAVLIVPVWMGRSDVVQYRDWKLSGVTPKQRKLLLKYGWPTHALKHGDWRNWGGLRLRKLTIQIALVESDRGLIPIALYVKEDRTHNALLQRNILQGHGFPTDLGWFKCVAGGTKLTEAEIKPSSNKMRLPTPIGWSVLKL